MATNTILIIDDEPANRNSIIRLLDEFDLTFVEAGNGQEGLDALAEHQPDLILLDITMPVKDGFGFLEALTADDKKTLAPICVMTALGDSNTRRRCISLGADDFITKPFDPVELETRITSLLRISNYQHDLRLLNENLERRVKERTTKLQRALEDLEVARKASSRAYREMITRINSLAARSSSIHNENSRRAALYAASIAWLMGLPADISENMAVAAQLHDIGLLAIPERLRNTAINRMNAEEKTLYFNHTRIGAELFAGTDIPLLQLAHDICAGHHERFDGQGSPLGLAGDKIPLPARIFAVCHHLAENIDPTRPRDVMIAQLRQSLSQEKGTSFDPDIIDFMLQSKNTLNTLLDQ